MSSGKVSKSVALRFLPGDDKAPRVIAKGEGRIGELIQDLASRHGVPKISDPLLVNSLSQLDLGQEIPEDLYRAVAVLFRYIWDQENDLR
jgi:FlhB-like protein